MSQFDFHTRNHPELNKAFPELRPNDLRHVSITKQTADVPNGLTIEKKAGTKEYYVKEVDPKGMFGRHGDRIKAGDRIVKINDKQVEEFMSLWDINNFLKKELTIKIWIKRDGFHLEKQKNPWGSPDYNVVDGTSKVERTTRTGL